MEFFLSYAATAVSKAIDRVKAAIPHLSEACIGRSPSIMASETQCVKLVPRVVPLLPPIQEHIPEFVQLQQQWPWFTRDMLDRVRQPFVSDEDELEFTAEEEPNFSLASPTRELLDAPVLEDMEAFVTPTAPTAPVAPVAPVQAGEDSPIVLTHTVTISGGDRSMRRNLAMEFARVAAPRPAGKRARDPEVEEVTRSGRPVKVPRHLEEYVVRSDLLDSDEE